MPRNKVESVRLTGRISENTSSKEDVEFVKEKLNTGFSQALLIREAIKVYRKYENGEFFKAKSSTIDKSNNKEKDQKIEGLKNKLNSGDFFN